MSPTPRRQACVPVWKALGAWAVNEEQLLQFFHQSRGVGSRDAVSVLKAWQEETETMFRKETWHQKIIFSAVLLKGRLA